MASAHQKGRENEERARPAPPQSELEATLGHSFGNPELLERALTHRSYANENKATGCRDNETLEFLGDAVLDLVVGAMLMERYPELGEGDLSKTRAQMVSEAGLCLVARELKLGNWLRLGRGEEGSGGRDKDSLLSDALEAVVAAIYLDAGFEGARDVVLAKFGPHVPASPGQRGDYKTQLQAIVQRDFGCEPVYNHVGQSGPDHDRVFEVAVVIDSVQQATACGRSKKAAEQAAAALTLEKLLRHLAGED